jgi:hypothetical protein
MASKSKNTLSSVLEEAVADLLPKVTEAAPTEAEPTTSTLKLPSKKTLQAIGGLSAGVALVSTVAGYGPLAAAATGVFGTVAIAQNFAEEDSHE